MSKADGKQTEIEKLGQYVEWIENGDLGSLWLEKAGKLVEKYPEYKPRLNEAISKGETKEIEQLEKYARRIEDGELRSLWLEKAGKLVEKYPEYKPRLNEAISKGETKEIEQFMRWIKAGDLEWIKKAGELVAKHPEYKPRLDAATSVGRRASRRENVRKRTAAAEGKMGYAEDERSISTSGLTPRGYIDDSSLIPVPAELSRLPAEYAGKIRTQIEQFNHLRKQLAETNDWKSSGKLAYNSILELFDYSKSRNGEAPEKEMAFLDDVPELQAPLAIGLDRLTMGLTAVREEGIICETRYNYWLDKIGSMKNRILDYTPKEST